MAAILTKELDTLKIVRDLQFEGAWSLNDTYCSWLLELSTLPGEHQRILFLDSFSGGTLPSAVIRSESWHRYHHINESENEMYFLAASGPMKEWLDDSYCQLTNLPIDTLLNSLNKSFMAVFSSISLFNLTDQMLYQRLGLLHQRLHKNGAFVFLGTVRPSSSHLDALFELKESRRSTGGESVEWNHDRNEDDYARLFKKAGFESEVFFKSYPYQAWLLTKPECKLFNA